MASLTKAFAWFGFGSHDHGPGPHTHGNHDHGPHGHTHGVIDPTITTTERGIWAIKWSFVILAITAALQLGVVFISGSVALLADTIHNIGDAATAIPLWFAFILARRKPSKTFTYGLGRVEDLAGILIVLIILFSAIVAGYTAIDRLIHPQLVTELGWLTAAGIVGFMGNEAVAVFRIRVGRQMNSAALIADGYHARTDGLTSLAVVLGALGVWLGFPLADPIVGLLITVVIFGIVWQSGRAVITRSLDGVEPETTEEIHHAAEHVAGIVKVLDTKARWIGHKLHAEVAIAVDVNLTVATANGIATALQRELHAHLPALSNANVRFGSIDSEEHPPVHSALDHRHAPEPFSFRSKLADGVVEIIDTPKGERMRLVVSGTENGLTATVLIHRPNGEIETLQLTRAEGYSGFQSSAPPAEPHEFSAELHLQSEGRSEVLPFRMVEPVGHVH